VDSNNFACVSIAFGRDLSTPSFVCDHMNDGELERRLSALGRRRIDAATRDAHLRRIQREVGEIGTAERPEAPRRRPIGAISVAAAALIGFAVGSTGLAMADALPDPAQRVAHDVLGAIQVDVPSGRPQNRGACVSAAAKLEDEAAKQSAKDACPRGGPPENDDSTDGSHGRSDTAPGHSKTNGQPPGAGKHEGDPCRGRPAWAGPMSKADRQAAREANSRANCPEDDGASEDETAPATEDTSEPPTTISAPPDAVEPPSDSTTTDPADTAATDVPGSEPGSVGGGVDNGGDEDAPASSTSAAPDTTSDG
jgi:hypothetical protein